MTTWTGHLARLVRARLGPSALVEASARADGDELTVARARLLDVLRFLKADPDADIALLVDLTAIEHPQPLPSETESTTTSEGASTSAVLLPPPRFEVRYLLRSPRLHYRVHVVVRVEEDEPIPSVTRLHPSAEWLERELFEMFGVYVDGHPHLRPLLLYPGFEGHPLRLGYRASKAQPLVPLVPLLGPNESARAPVVVDDAGAPAAPAPTSAPTGGGGGA